MRTEWVVSVAFDCEEATADMEWVVSVEIGVESRLKVSKEELEEGKSRQLG